MGRPLFMATSKIRVRLQRADDEVRVDDVFGGSTNFLEDRHQDYIELEGQPRFDKEDKRRPVLAGDAQDTRGYATFSIEHLVEKNISNPQQLKNARVIAYERGGSWVNKQYDIVEVRHRGHLRGGPIIVKCFVEEYDDKRGAV